MAVTREDHELKILVDKQDGRVLFAEADGGFMNHLFYFLKLPLGNPRVFGTLGCLGRLNLSVKSLADEYFCAVQFKDWLLGPISREIVSFNKTLKFIITDNLQVTPVVPGTILGYLNNLGTVDLSTIEERTVKLGVPELVEFLKCALHSTTPLTDLFGAKTNPPLRSVHEKVFLHKKPSGEGRKINVKVVLKKSSKEFLFVEAGGDFIDFLFSFLLIPLAQVLHILEGQSGLGCIEGLYKSAEYLDSKHFVSQAFKDYLLIRPKLPPDFIWENHLLPLDSTPMSHTMPRAGGIVRKEAAFIVLDDLTVKPSSTAATISIMNARKASFSDLEERTLSLGMAEGISILRASLNSTSAISDGLLHSILRASLNSTSAISDGLLHNDIVFVKEPKKEK